MGGQDTKPRGGSRLQIKPAAPAMDGNEGVLLKSQLIKALNTKGKVRCWGRSQVAGWGPLEKLPGK